MRTTRFAQLVRRVGVLALLMAGLALGAAVPATAETDIIDTATACGESEAMSAAESEWAVPPSPRLPGEPY